MKRVVRKRRLTAKQAAKYDRLRAQIEAELPELVSRHRQRQSDRQQWEELLHQLKNARKEQGLSLADITRLAGMDRSAISKLENGRRPNPTLETLARYAEAIGKRLVVRLADASKR